MQCSTAGVISMSHIYVFSSVSLCISSVWSIHEGLEMRVRGGEGWGGPTTLWPSRSIVSIVAEWTFQMRGDGEGATPSKSQEDATQRVILVLVYYSVLVFWISFQLKFRSSFNNFSFSLTKITLPGGSSTVLYSASEHDFRSHTWITHLDWSVVAYFYRWNTQD